MWLEGLGSVGIRGGGGMGYLTDKKKIVECWMPTVDPNVTTGTGKTRFLVKLKKLTVPARRRQKK